jgi:phage shock protein B
MSVMIFMVPLIIFMVIVAPLWLVLHYRGKRHSERGLSQEEFQQLQSLSAKADSLQQRITTLERILDAETPNWRSDYGSS